MKSEMVPHIMMISTHGYVAAEPELGRPDTGGQVVYVLELSKALARMGYRVDVLTRRFEQQPQEEAVAEGVRLLRFECGGDEFIPKEKLCEAIPEWVRNVEGYVNATRTRYAAINSHYWDAGLAGSRLARTLGIPHVHTPHSLGAWKRDQMRGNGDSLDTDFYFARRIFRETEIYRDCDAVIATTAEQARLLADGEYGVEPEKVHRLPPGYDELRFHPVGRSERIAIKHRLELEGPLVCSLGRAAANKGYDRLIRALPIVLRRIPEARLLLAIGSEDPTPEEESYIAGLKGLSRELGVRNSILFRDFIPDAELPDYYRAADVFALSSIYEPFGMTAIEAMACGTPTVVTTHGGLWEELVWGQEALYADPWDDGAFGHALLTLLAQPRVAAQVASGGARAASERYRWSRVARGFSEILVRAGAVASWCEGETRAAAPSRTFWRSSEGERCLQRF